MASNDVVELWPEVDRIALCVHRPAGQRPEFRGLVERLRIPAGSMLVSAARHIARGEVTIGHLELLGRYQSRSLVVENADRHVALGFLTRKVPGVFTPSDEIRDAARTVLRFQAEAADELWSGHGDLARLAELAGAVVDAASAPVRTPAFDAQRRDHDAVPSSDAGQLLAFVTELRYLRSDLHAVALARHDLAGPRARALDQVWKGHHVTDADAARLESRGLVVRQGQGWSLTEDGHAVRNAAEVATNDLAAETMRSVGEEQLADLLAGLRRLPGEDPRPPDTR